MCRITINKQHWGENLGFFTAIFKLPRLITEHQYEYNSKIYRIKIDKYPRVFNVVARNSAKFQTLYNTRTSVERYHSRLDRDLGFENLTIRGLKKMKVMVTLTDIIMLAIALVHIDNGQTNYASIFDF